MQKLLILFLFLFVFFNYYTYSQESIKIINKKIIVPKYKYFLLFHNKSIKIKLSGKILLKDSIPFYLVGNYVVSKYSVNILDTNFNIITARLVCHGDNFGGDFSYKDIRKTNETISEKERWDNINKNIENEKKQSILKIKKQIIKKTNYIKIKEPLKWTYKNSIGSTWKYDYNFKKGKYYIYITYKTEGSIYYSDTIPLYIK